MINLDKLLEDFRILLDSFTEKDLDEWIKMDEERLSNQE